MVTTIAEKAAEPAPFTFSIPIGPFQISVIGLSAFRLSTDPRNQLFFLFWPKKKCTHFLSEDQ